MKLTILYARVSKEEQGDSLPAQISRLQQRADAEGWENAQLVQEAASSTDRPIIVGDLLRGKIKTGRPRLNEIMQQVRDGAVERIVVDDPNRLARDPAERHILRSLLAEAGIEFIALSMPSTGNPLADYYGGESKAMADGGFKQQLSLDVKRGRDATAAAGRHQSAPPWGYRLEPMRDDHGDFVLSKRGRVVKQIEVVAEEAAAVRLMFERFAQSWSQGRLAGELNDAGFSTRRPMRREEVDDAGEKVARMLPRPFTRVSVGKMLACEFYVAFDDADPDKRGTVVRVRHAGGRSKHRCQPCREDCSRPCLSHCQTTKHRGLHQALITRELFERCQGITRGRKLFENRPRRDHGKAFLVWSLIRCAECDSRLHPALVGGRGAREYYRHKGGVDCTWANKHIARHRVDFDMDKLVINDLAQPLDVARRWSLVQQLRMESRLTSNREVAEKEIARLERERARLLWQHRKQFIPDHEAEREVAAIERQIAQLRPRDDAPAPAHVQDSFTAFRRAWGEAGPGPDGQDRRRQLLATMIEAAYIDCDRQRIIGIRPTPEYADYFVVGEDGQAPMDWLGWRIGRGQRPWAHEPEANPATKRASEQRRKNAVDEATRRVAYDDPPPKQR